MELVNVVDEELGNLKSSKWMLQWKEMLMLYQFVDHHQDPIMAIGLGKSFNEVQADSMPCCRWHREGLK
jgi:hypothetical protein